MAIITLTTDMGTRDYYVAALKGSIYSQLPDATLVDISHHIPPFDIAQAAFVLKNCYKDFPKGTIHIMGVNPESSKDVGHVIVSYSGQWFIGADNGIFSLLFEKQPDAIFELNITPEVDEFTFPTKFVFGKAACHIARGGTPEIIGKRIEKLQQRQIFRPVAEENFIRGGVQYIDSYGNVLTNITKALFNEVGRGRPFTIFFRRATYDINTINRSYNEVPEGEKVAIFSSSGYLEIAINKGVEGSGGGANKLFGLKLNDIVTIQFES